MRQKDTSALEIDTGLAMQDPHKKKYGIPEQCRTT